MLSSCSAARALRRYSRNAARPSTIANTTAVGMTAAMMMVLRGGPLDAADVAACPAPVQGSKPRVSSESGFESITASAVRVLRWRPEGNKFLKAHALALRNAVPARFSSKHLQG